jgi:OsmC-like protein
LTLPFDTVWGSLAESATLRLLSESRSQKGPERPRGGEGRRQEFRGFIWAALGAAALGIPLYAERKGWTLDRIETRLTRDAGEGKIDSIELELLLGGDLSDEQRQRLAEIASRCPVHRSLTEGVAITHGSSS